MTFRRFVLSAAAAGLFLSPVPARAEDFPCPPSRGAVILDGNVVVGGACTLDGTLVKGNVFLEDAGDLLAQGATIIGNVQSDGAVRARLHESAVNGDVQLTGIDGPARSEVLRSVIGGTVDVAGNAAPFELRENVVGSDLKANTNTGGVVIRGNGIDGNLQCQGNAPPPTGGDNVVGGNEEDQCENLMPADTTTTTLPAAQVCGDHNGDGNVATSDALVVLKKAVGFDIELLCP